MVYLNSPMLVLYIQQSCFEYWHSPFLSCLPWQPQARNPVSLGRGSSRTTAFARTTAQLAPVHFYCSSTGTVETAYECGLCCLILTRQQVPRQLRHLLPSSPGIVEALHCCNPNTSGISTKRCAGRRRCICVAKRRRGPRHPHHAIQRPASHSRRPRLRCSSGPDPSAVETRTGCRSTSAKSTHHPPTSRTCQFRS